MRPLGRIPSKTDEHIKKYPLTASILDKLAGPVPMAIGINWYENFDNPETDSAGHHWIGRSTELGSVRGGHCVCLKQRGASDYYSWWDYYDQGQEGRCVQFGTSRMMSLLNRKKYEVRQASKQGHWLYYEAQRHDDWPGGAYPGADPQYEGTSVNAALWVIKNEGIIPFNGSTPSQKEGISEFRWATDWNDVKKALGYSDVNYVDILNSWGRSYPHQTRMPDDVGARLLAEQGEFGIVTDR